jgi:hypothetical protein
LRNVTSELPAILPPSGAHLARLWRALMLALAACLAGCASLPPGQGWVHISPGLAHAQVAPWPDSVVHVLRLDLHEPTLRWVATPWAERGNTLDRMPGADAALVAVNASFFNRQFDARGWTVSEGLVWPGPLAVKDSPLLACDRAQRCRIHFEAPAAPPADWFNAVAGTPWLVRAGVARSAVDDAACPGLCANDHPRTAVGLDASRRFLWIVLVEGRRPGVPGVRLGPLAQWMQGMGVHDAVNLDGGGSSALFIAGRSVMARPANEPEQRRIANGMLVLRKAWP